MITLIILISTVLVSLTCFQRPDLFSKLDYSPYEVRTKKEWYRLLSHSFVHADWIHLIVNMLVFFSFGRYVEQIFEMLENQGLIPSGKLFYILLYFAGVVVASIPSYLKHKNNPNYVSVGASGAVSAVLFMSIFFSPMEMIYFYGVIPMPGILFGVLYLAYSTYMSRSGRDNINHDAHLWGAIFGFIFPILINPRLINVFLNNF